MLAEQIAQGATAVLVGHTDIRGDAERNRQVGLRRAIAARNAFESRGVMGLVTESAGESCIGAENVTESGRRANQRVELWVRPPEDDAKVLRAPGQG